MVYRKILLSNSNHISVAAYSHYIHKNLHVYILSALLSIWRSINIIRFLNFWNFFLSIIVLQYFCYLYNFASAIQIFLWEIIASYPEYISLKCFYKGYSWIQMTDSIIKWSYNYYKQMFQKPLNILKFMFYSAYI